MKKVKIWCIVSCFILLFITGGYASANELRSQSVSITGMQPRNATGYHVKKREILGTRTYTNKKLKSIKTSSLWNKAPNSVKPKISVSRNTSVGFSVNLADYRGVTATASSSWNVTQTYTASPKSKGLRVELGLYANQVKATTVKLYFYSNATNKLSHTQVVRTFSYSGFYIGRRDY